MPFNFSVRPDNISSFTLFILTIVNYVLMYLANIYLARNMDIEAFDDYSVAVSIVTLLASIATLGLEKYALRLVAIYLERQAWGKLKGFWIFSLRTILFFSLLLIGLLSISLESFLALSHADFHIAIVIYTLFLPIIALTLFLIEVITVFGYRIFGMILYRFLLPCAYLLAILFLQKFGFAVSAVSAVICFGIAWLMTLIIMFATARLISPAEMKGQQPVINGKKWLSGSFPLVLSSLMMTVMNSGGIIILELLYPSEAIVGTYAIAVQTTSLIALIGTSTNRYYLPMVVVLIERKDQNLMRKLMLKRMLFISSLTLTFLLLILFFGHAILELFGPNYREGYSTLLIIALGASINTLFSDSPYYLQFIGRHRLVVGMTVITATLTVFLSALLGKTFGSIGVAMAYAIPVSLLFILFKSMSSRHIKQLV